MDATKPTAIRKDRMAINMRMAENPDELQNAKILRFDGAKSWKDVGTCVLKEPWW